MRRAGQRARGIRVSLPQLLVVASVSAVVSALIVISATAQTGPERAVIAALRERHVIHAPAAAPAARTPAATVAPADPDTPAATPAAAAPSTSDGAVSPPPAATPSTATASSTAPTESQTPDPAEPAPKPA